MTGTRGAGARLGVTLLNFLACGLGLIRIGEVRLGLGFYAAQIGILAILQIATFSSSRFSLALLVIIAALVVLQLALLIAALVLTARRSGERRERQVMSRWPVLLAFVVVTSTALYLLPTPFGPYRVFSIPSRSMIPQLEVGDRIAVDTRRREPRRGAVMVFRMGKDQWLYRVAALPGDRIAVREGIVILNGTPVPQLPRGSFAFAEGDGFGPEGPASRLVEQFPGEAGSHTILNTDTSAGDNFDEQIVPAGHVFFLGDNRDNAADGRYRHNALGDGSSFVPVADLIGTVDFIYWSPNPSHRFKSVEAVAAMVDQGR